MADPSPTADTPPTDLPWRVWAPYWAAGFTTAALWHWASVLNNPWLTVGVAAMVASGVLLVPARWLSMRGARTLTAEVAGTPAPDEG